jgi:hypothetical protein
MEVTLGELEEWLEMLRSNYERPYQYMATLLDREIKRRKASGNKPSPIPLKERNRAYQAKSREKKREAIQKAQYRASVKEILKRRR